MKAKAIKALVLAVCAVLLVISTVFATMAFLTSTTNPIQNTFTVGNVQITLDEAKVDEYGNPVDPAQRTKPDDVQNVYRLIPGHTYTKDPTVTVVQNSEDCYVYAKVTIEGFDTLRTACNKPNMLPQEIINDWKASEWECTSYTVDDGNAVCMFTYTSKVERNKNEATKLPELFQSFTLPGAVEYNAELATIKVSVIAYAVQADGFNNAAEAWNAAFANS